MIAKAPITEFDLFLRLWDRANLTPTLAKQLLKLGFGDDDRAIIAELTAKNRTGAIAPGELEELDKYVRVGGILSVLHSRARKALRKQS